MADTNSSEAATSFQWDPPSAGPSAVFPFNPGTENAADPAQALDVGADSGVDSPNVPAGPPSPDSDVNFAAIQGVPCPDDHGTDTYQPI